MPRDGVVHADTTPDAHRVQARAYREMGGAARVRIAFDLSDFARRLTEAGIRRRHPAWPGSPLLEP